MSNQKTARERFWGAPVPPGLRHGKNTWASRIYGCDCRECLPSGQRRTPKGQGMTRTERDRRLRENKRGKPIPAGVKHGRYVYRTYGCKCDVCMAANRAVVNRPRKSWRDTATGIWDQRDDKDVLHWPPAGVGAWTCPECGQTMRRRQDAQAA